MREIRTSGSTRGGAPIWTPPTLPAPHRGATDGKRSNRPALSFHLVGFNKILAYPTGRNWRAFQAARQKAITRSSVWPERNVSEPE